MMIVTVIAAGKIGVAVARSISKSRKVSEVILTKRNTSSVESHLSDKIGVITDNREAAKKADVIIISVKAGDAKGVLGEISEFTKQKIVISLMAAISIKKLGASLRKARIV